MGNRICGRLAASRQARIERRNSNCCQAQVYYCNRPQVYCQPVYHQQVQHAQQLNSSIDLDFKSMQPSQIDSSSTLGQWLNNRRQETEVNTFSVGDIHILEIKGDSPKLQFFDKAGNKWQALSQQQTLEFYQSKEKFLSQETKNNPKEDTNMAGVIGNSPKATQGLVNGNKSESNSGAGSSSGSESNSGASSGAGANSGAGSISTSSGGGVTNIIDNSRPVANENSGPDAFIKHGNTELAGKGTIYNIDGNLIIGNRNIGSASGSSTVVGGDAMDNGAIGREASNGGMSKKEKKKLQKLLDRNFGASVDAANFAQEAADAAKQAARASKKSSENSGAARIAAEQTHEALSKLPEQLQNQVKGAIDELNTRLDKARTDLQADQSQANKDQLAEIQKFARAYLGKVEKLVPDLAKEIAPLIKIEVPKPEIPEINLNLQIEEFEAKPQPVQPQENAPIGGQGTLVKLAA